MLFPPPQDSLPFFPLFIEVGRVVWAYAGDTRFASRPAQD